MSTYWRLECLTHDPNITSAEISQHTDYRLDKVRKMWSKRKDIEKAIKLLDETGLEIKPEFDDYMDAIAYRFILDHIDCNIQFRNEYGEIESMGQWAQPQYEDTAVLITDFLRTPSGEFFMHDQAIIGWFCVRSTDPQKTDLFLPSYIFHKCFSFEEPRVPNHFVKVKEKRR